jgi:hypothetical protein
MPMPAVPRMSVASIANAWLRVVRFNWTDAFLQDFDQSVDFLSGYLLKLKMHTDWIDESSRNIRQILITLFDQKVAPGLKNLPKATEKESELIPHGNCVHLHRDGTSWQGAYTSCNFFQELEVVRHLVDDHSIPTVLQWPCKLCSQAETECFVEIRP